MSATTVTAIQSINAWTGGTGSYFVVNNATSVTTSTAVVTTTAFTNSSTNVQFYQQANDFYAMTRGNYDNNLRAGNIYNMPDGSVLQIDNAGNYTIMDKDARVTYQACRIRDFNQFLNASDLLEEYIRELVPLGIRQDEVLHLEIDHFINWLIHKAAERDGDDAPTDITKYPEIRAEPIHYDRCRCCGRFIRRSYVHAGILFCSADHMERQLVKLSFHKGVAHDKEEKEKEKENRSQTTAGDKSLAISGRTDRQAVCSRSGDRQDSSRAA